MQVRIPIRFTVKFAVNYLIKYIINEVESHKGDPRLNNIGSEFGFNAYEALLFIVQHLLVDVQTRYIIISVNKNLHWHGYNLEKLLNIITFGSRINKGCDIFTSAVDFINKHYEAMYLQYLGGKQWQ